MYTSFKKIRINIIFIVIICVTVLISLSLLISIIQWNSSLFRSIYTISKNNIFLILFVILLLILLLIWMFYELKKQISNLISRYLILEHEKLKPPYLFGMKEIPVGILSYNDNYIVWISDYFSAKIKKKLLHSKLNVLIKQIEDQNYKKQLTDDTVYYSNVRILDNIFDIYHNKCGKLLYFFDKKQEYILNKKIDENKIVIGFIYLDTPEEIDVAEDQQIVDIGSEINRSILRWAKKYDISCKKYATNRWILFTNKKMLSKIIKKNMSVRDDIHKLSKKLKLNLTITGGFSIYSESMEQTLKNSVNAVEYGQSRGGDQVIVSNYNDDGYLILGEDNKQKKRFSRVMVRQIASQLHEEIEHADIIFCISHKYADFDAIGSMMGIYEIAKTYNKKIFCVLNMETLGQEINQLNILLNEEKDLANFNKIVIDSKQMLDMFSNSNLKKLIFILDTNNINLLESKELTHSNSRIFLIDHHKKGRKNNFIENANVEYIDTLTSSTSELVTELIQYQPITIDISVITATFLIAGIILDTNNFTRNVSSRTFDAASFLRKMGALQSYVLKVYSKSIDEYISYSKYLLGSEKIKNNGRILIINNKIARQELSKIAEYLITFQEIKYSIVVGKDCNDDIINVSARSKGSINVEKIVEHFGGGGHYNSAAVQIRDLNINQIKESLTKYINNL